MTLPPKARWRNSTTRKYGNKKVELDGYLFDSKREAVYYLELKFRKKAGDVKEFEVKPKIYVYYRPDDLTIDWCEVPSKWGKETGTILLFTYTPDFKVGGKFIEVKGYATDYWKLKLKMLLAIRLPLEIVT